VAAKFLDALAQRKREMTEVELIAVFVAAILAGAVNALAGASFL